jgi:hypothetical protein
MSSDAQSSKDIPMVMVRISRCSSYIILMVSRMSPVLIILASKVASVIDAARIIHPVHTYGMRGGFIPNKKGLLADTKRPSQVQAGRSHSACLKSVLSGNSLPEKDPLLPPRRLGPEPSEQRERVLSES